MYTHPASAVPPKMPEPASSLHRAFVGIVFLFDAKGQKQMNSNFTLQKSTRRNGQVRPYQNEADESIIGIRNGIEIVLRSRGLIVAVTLAATAIGGIYASVKKPIYEGNMLIQVAEKRSGERRNMLGDVAATFDKETTAASEVGVIKSRAVIRNVVNSLQQHIDARPKYFFLIGSRISAMREELSNPGIAGLGGYCWGSEDISVKEFEVPDPYLDKEFVVTQLGGGRFTLTRESGDVTAMGRIGVPLKLQLTGGGLLQLNVASLEGLPGAQYRLKRKSELALVEGIQKSLVVAETGKETGLISVALRDVDPQMIYKVLSALGNEYIRQYQQRRTQSAEKSLALLESQLPGLKRNMEKSENNYKAFRNKNGTADLNEETKLRLQRLAGSEQSLLELEQKKSELLVRFGVAHPAISGIDKQISLVMTEKNALAERIKQFPIVEQELGRLARDVKMTTELYSTLLRTAQELRVISLEQAEGVRLVDVPVVPDTPINARSTTVALAAAFGLLLGLMSAFLRKVFFLQ